MFETLPGGSGPATNETTLDHNDRGPTAVVKGAGPSGLAAALSLIEGGFQPSHILVVEKRKFRPEGHGRKNMVAIRPEGLRRLDDLGCLKHARDRGWITDLKTGRTFNEWNVNLEGGGVFEWPISRYDIGMDVVDSADKERKQEDDDLTVAAADGVMSQADDKNDTVPYPPKLPYTKPGKITEQVPCCFIDLGHLEDALIHMAQEKNISIKWNASLEISPDKSETHTGDNDIQFKAVLVEGVDHESTDKCRTELGTPDLIICASGKNDHSLEEELGFRRYIGLKLESENVPSKGNRVLNLGGGEHEMESQLFSVFGVRTPAREMGLISHVVRKEDTGDPEQPVTEIQMRHGGSTHCLIQLPRGMNLENLDDHITQRVNSNLGTDFINTRDIEAKGALLWGQPLTPIVVETSTAPQYVFGSNVILVGDAAMSCSPSSGLGADIGMTEDSRNIAEFAAGFLKTLQHERGKSLTNEKDDGHIIEDATKQKTTNLEDKLNLLLAFNRRKAEASVLWSQGSRWFYITRAEADEILAAKSKIVEQQTRS